MAERHLPRTEVELAAMLADGTLSERFDFDFKEQLGPGKAATKSASKDLAAMAIDGGGLLYGVAEDKTAGTFSRAPFPLKDVNALRERIAQIALNSVDPPLTVRTIEIHSQDSPGCGYLLVVVPPSPAAPHMADDRYWGRSDTTNYPLHDAEVRRLHTLRMQREVSARELLDQEIERDPTKEAQGLDSQSHLFVVAQPTTGDSELLYQAIKDEPWRQWLGANVLNGAVGAGAGSQFSPDLYSGMQTSRRTDGWALHTYEMGEARRIRPNGEHPPKERHLLDLELREDGGIRLFCGGASDRLSDYSGAGPRVVFDLLVAGLTKRVVLLALLVAETAPYLGSWDFGMAVTNLRGMRWYQPERIPSDNPIYSEADYRMTTRATYEQLADAPEAIVERLFARLNRAMGERPTLKELKF